MRSTDLLSLANVNPDSGFAVQMSIEENLAETSLVCFQAALLYTSSKGELLATGDLYRSWARSAAGELYTFTAIFKPVSHSCSTPVLWARPALSAWHSVGLSRE